MQSRNISTLGPTLLCLLCKYLRDRQHLTPLKLPAGLAIAPGLQLPAHYPHSQFGISEMGADLFSAIFT